MRFHSINIRDIVVEALATGGIIVDVRDRERFSDGHIPMAINVPLEEIQKGNISLPRSREVILYCETGGSSTLAAKLLSEKGYRVVNTIGGIKAYKGSLSSGNWKNNTMK